MAAPRVPTVDLGGGRPASGDSARAALVNPVSQTEATQRLKGSNVAAGFEGLAKLAIGAAEMFKKQDIDRDQITAVEMEGRFMRLNDEGMAKLDPMSPDYAQQVKDLIKQNSDAVVADGQFRTREVQDETTRRFARIGAAAEIQAVDNRRKSIAGEAERVYTERLEQLYGAIRKDPNGYDVHVAAFQADAARLRSGISPDRLRIISHAAADGMLAAKVEGLAQNGNFAGARKFLDDNSGSFKPETNRMLRGVINGLEDKAQRNYALASTDLAARTRIDIIKQADADAPVTVTREKLDGMLKSGALRPQDADSLYAQLAVADKARTGAIETTRTAIRNFDIGAHTPQEADLVWRAAFGQAVEKKGGQKDKVDPFNSPEGLEAAILVADKGIVPPTLSRVVENLANSGGPGSGDIEIVNLAKAATIYKAIRERSPDAKWTFEKNDRISLVLEQAKANGGDISQAARDVMKNLPKDAKIDADRVEQGRDAARKIDWAAESRVVLGDFFNRQLQSTGSMLRTGARYTTLGPVTDELGMGSVIPKGEDKVQIPADLQAEYKENFVRNFRLNGNVELAKAAALEQIKADWRVTYVAGDKQPYVMKNAPAQFLPAEKAWLREDIDKIMAEAVTKKLRLQGWVPVTDDVRKGNPAYVLEADRITLAEAAAKDPKNPPSYLVKVMTQDRVYHTVGRIRMPTDDELKSMPLYKDRVQSYTDRVEAQGARDVIDRAVQDRANRRRGR